MPPPDAVPDRRALWLYSWGWRLATPLLGCYLLYRSLAQPEYRQHWGERWGFWPAERSTADIDTWHTGRVRPLWVHAVSVGETVAMLPLLRQCAAAWPDVPILLTHATPTGRATGQERLKDLTGRLAQSYLPYDTPGAVERFLTHWNPAIGLIMETEVWPNLVAAANRHDVPLVSVNARLSPRSLARGQRFESLIRPAVAGFSMIIAQTQDDAERIALLGKRPEAVTGNLKFDQPADFVLQARGQGWRKRLGNRPVVLAASTREGEEALILESWREVLLHRHPRLGGRTAGPGPAGGRHQCCAPLGGAVVHHPGRPRRRRCRPHGHQRRRPRSGGRGRFGRRDHPGRPRADAQGNGLRAGEPVRAHRGGRRHPGSAPEEG